MSEDEKLFRAKFNRLLEPIKVMLVNRKKNLSPEDWNDFVQQTKLSVIGHPDQYLGAEIPRQALLVSIVNKIFEEFIVHESL